jgi:hypothetical protein
LERVGSLKSLIESQNLLFIPVYKRLAHSHSFDIENYKIIIADGDAKGNGACSYAMDNTYFKNNMHQI